MADYSWPATLPTEPLLEGFEEKPSNVVIRTQMDKGPDKIRRRFTAGVRPIKVRYDMTSTQVATFDDFFTSTLSGGASRFDMDDPRTSVSCEFRFVGVPSYRPTGGGRWEVQFELEQMP